MAVGALLSLLLLDSGLVGRAIPADYESPPKYWLLALAILAAVLSLFYARRQMRTGQHDPGQSPA